MYMLAFARVTLAPVVARAVPSCLSIARALCVLCPPSTETGGFEGGPGGGGGLARTRQISHEHRRQTAEKAPASRAGLHVVRRRLARALREPDRLGRGGSDHQGRRGRPTVSMPKVCACVYVCVAVWTRGGGHGRGEVYAFIRPRA